VFTTEINARPHRVTRRAPVEMLAEEQARLHPVAVAPFTAAFGVTRTVAPTTPMVNFDHCQYSVPHGLVGETVWVRRYGEHVVIVHVGAGGPVEVARHQQGTPGNPRVEDAHFPPAPAGALARTPRPKTSSETTFLGLGDGAALWLTEAAAAGATRVRAKMAEAVELGRLHGDTVVDRALGQAGLAGRFAEGDVAAILSHQASATPGPAARAGEDHTLAQGTTGWAGFGEPKVTP
jgi:hypothetical protein